jgi:hypothetical protein
MVLVILGACDTKEEVEDVILALGHEISVSYGQPLAPKTSCPKRAESMYTQVDSIRPGGPRRYLVEAHRSSKIGHRVLTQRIETAGAGYSIAASAFRWDTHGVQEVFRKGRGDLVATQFQHRLALWSNDGKLLDWGSVWSSGMCKRQDMTAGDGSVTVSLDCEESCPKRVRWGRPSESSQTKYVVKDSDETTTLEGPFCRWPVLWGNGTNGRLDQFCKHSPDRHRR